MAEEQQSSWETESSWEPEDVKPRDKLLYFICNRVKQGATREQLIEEEIPRHIEENGLPDFTQPDISGMVGWARRKFAPPEETEPSGEEEL